MIIRFHADADAELAEAREWYAHQREDLDIECMQCIDEALSRIVLGPHLYPMDLLNLRKTVRQSVFHHRIVSRTTTVAPRNDRGAVPLTSPSLGRMVNRPPGQLRSICTRSWLGTSSRFIQAPFPTSISASS